MSIKFFFFVISTSDYVMVLRTLIFYLKLELFNMYCNLENVLVGLAKKFPTRSNKQVITGKNLFLILKQSNNSFCLAKPDSVIEKLGQKIFLALSPNKYGNMTILICRWGFLATIFGYNEVTPDWTWPEFQIFHIETFWPCQNYCLLRFEGKVIDVYKWCISWEMDF